MLIQKLSLTIKSGELKNAKMFEIAPPLLLQNPFQKY